MTGITRRNARKIHALARFIYLLLRVSTQKSFLFLLPQGVEILGTQTHAHTHTYTHTHRQTRSFVVSTHLLIFFCLSHHEFETSSSSSNTNNKVARGTGRAVYSSHASLCLDRVDAVLFFLCRSCQWFALPRLCVCVCVCSLLCGRLLMHRNLSSYAHTHTVSHSNGGSVRYEARRVALSGGLSSASSWNHLNAMFDAVASTLLLLLLLLLIQLGTDNFFRPSLSAL